MQLITSLCQTNYKILVDNCISSKNVSKIYLASHRQKPLIHKKIKVKVIDLTKFPQIQKQKYPKYMKKILLNNIKFYYQCISDKGDLPEDLFKVYRAGQLKDQNNPNDYVEKDVFYILNQYHKGQQLRKCILSNNQHFQDPQKVRKFGKNLLWNMIRGGGIQKFLYTSTNTIVDDIRFELNTNCISTTGMLFIESVLDSKRRQLNAKNNLKNNQKQIQEKQKVVEDCKKDIIELKIKLDNLRKQQKNKSQLLKELAPFIKSYSKQHQELHDNTFNQYLEIKKQLSSAQEKHKQKQQQLQKEEQKLKQLNKTLQEFKKIIQQQQIYLKNKIMSIEQFLQVYPFLHKDILELPENQKTLYQRQLKQKIRNFTSLYLMMITRKDLHLKHMQFSQNEIKELNLDRLKEKLNNLSQSYQIFLQKEKIKQRIHQYQKKIQLQADTLYGFFQKILVRDDYDSFKENFDQQIQIKPKNNKTYWRYIYQVCGFLKQKANQIQQKHYQILHKKLFEIESKKYLYKCQGIADPLFYLPVKYNLNFLLLTSDYKHWYSSFQDNKFSVHVMKAINNIKCQISHHKQKLNLLSQQQHNKTFQYLNAYESRFFLKTKEYDIVLNEKIQHVKYDIPTDIYMSNFAYLCL